MVKALDSLELFEMLPQTKIGNIYVSDRVRKCIHMFSNDGKFLQSFGQDGSDAKKLQNARGVSVVGQYVYVADFDGHCVHVFTTEGQYVTSFGQKGKNEGNFNNPTGMCADEDGSLYVCEYSNGRVQKF